MSTNQYTHPDYRGRAALTDIPQSGLFVVRLLRLSLGDVGLYRCGIGDRNDMLFFSVNLTVSAGMCRWMAKGPIFVKPKKVLTLRQQKGVSEGGRRKTPGGKLLI